MIGATITSPSTSTPAVSKKAAKAHMQQVLKRQQLLKKRQAMLAAAEKYDRKTFGVPRRKAGFAELKRFYRCLGFVLNGCAKERGKRNYFGTGGRAGEAGGDALSSFVESALFCAWYVQ